MSRPRVSDIDRLANKLWLAKLLLEWRRREEKNARRFSLSSVAKHLLALSNDPNSERGHGRERLQALTTIRRIGSDPTKCLRMVSRDQLPKKVSDWALDVTKRRQANRRSSARKRDRSRPSATVAKKRIFRIDAVARADQWFPEVSAWHRPTLMLALRSPGLSRDTTRALIALELARLGFMRPETMELEHQQSRLKRGFILESDDSVVSRWSKALTPLCRANSIEAVGVMALLLHEARISFAPEQVCFSIFLALDEAVDELLKAPELKEFAIPIRNYIHKYLWSQRWEDAVEEPLPSPFSPPISVKEWLRRCERKPWWEQTSGLPDVPEISDVGMATVDALHSRVWELRPKERAPKAMKVTGIAELRHQMEPIWNQWKNGDIARPVKRTRRK